MDGGNPLVAGRVQESVVSTDIASLIAAQNGIISLGQAVEHGMSPDAVERKVKAGDWIRVYRGVFRSAQHHQSHEARLRAAVLLTDGVAYGPSAAWWHGVIERAPVRLSITIPKSRRVRTPAGIDLRHRTLNKADITTERGLSVTSIELSALEAGDSTVIDRVLQSGVSIDRLKEVHGRNGKCAGSARISALLRIAESGGRSEAERILHRILEPLPGWSAQVKVGSYALDAAFVSVKVGIEVDGWRWHKDVVRNGRDQQRHNQLEIAGWLMLRFDWHRLTQDPGGVLQEVGDAVRARRLLVNIPASAAGISSIN